MDVAIMIEGQNGLNWPRWQRIATAVEELGFAGLYRSDHFTNASPPDLDSLELWTSLTWLADHTARIAFGPLVSPVSFRHPAMTARMATAVDDLSGGTARYAHEWNVVFATAARFAELNTHLDALLARRGRRPDDVRRSLMTGTVFGRNDAEVRRNLGGRSEDTLRERGVIVGTPGVFTDALERLAQSGVQRIMLQWLDLDDLDGLEALARAVTPWL